MSLWSRVANVFRGDRLNREIAEEFESHIKEAVATGRDEREARRALGTHVRHREEGHQARVIGWLDSLRADAIFGWRQLKRNRVTSAAAILSLALAIGACTSAFRLMDALLWRPLPVAHADQLYDIWRETAINGAPYRYDSWAYPSYQLMRDAVKDRAQLLAVSPAERTDLTYGSDDDMEKAHVQYVSGSMFGAFGLRPALGRLLDENDDRIPKASPYAVLSYDYWQRRFGRDPKVIGRSLRMGTDLYQIVGVVDLPFTGTDPGTLTDVFLPMMMNPSLTRKDASWMRTLAIVHPGVALGPLTEKMSAISLAFEMERAKGFKDLPNSIMTAILSEKLTMKPAGAGVSELQDQYRRALGVIGVLVALVLLIACANVANLMTAQAATRAQEMALRVSIGAGRLRLVQMVLTESVMMAVLASLLAAAFAWWSAPLVVSMINPPDDPARLMLPGDWRVLGFGLLLVFMVVLLFGLAPALRASAVKPVDALKGSDDPHGRRKGMYVMIGAQVAFCFVVVFIAGLFVTTFQRLAHKPLGFEPENLLLLDTVAQREQPASVWDQAVDGLRGVSGVEDAAICAAPLLGGTSWNNFISINGAPPGPIVSHFLEISPDWMRTMRMPLINGRDFRNEDTTPGAAIVNETFAKTFFHGENPVGKTFERESRTVHYQIVGMVRDAPYRSLREPTLPVAFIPTHEVDAAGALRGSSGETFVVRTRGMKPTVFASLLRQRLHQIHPELRVSNIRTQMELVRDQTIRERLLAMLAAFFAAVALLLAGIGLYGVLHYSVLQRQREIGIRIALGARIANIARLITSEIFAMVIAGGAVGVALGLVAAKYVRSLLYGVKGNDPAMLFIPAIVLLAAAVLSALPAVMRAARIDPAKMLRAE